VAYSLELHPQNVVPYLRDAAPLSRQGRLKLFLALDELRLRGDIYIGDPDRRLNDNPLRFFVDWLLIDDEGDGLLHRFRFIINATGAQYGVLQVEYVEQD
jgi:hypothetical protein